MNKDECPGKVIDHHGKLLILNQKICITSKIFDNLALDHILELGVIENEILS